LCITRTLSPKDLLTDLCCTAEEFATHEDEVKEAVGETSSIVDEDLFRSSFRTKIKRARMMECLNLPELWHYQREDRVGIEIRL
jgi:hypothetical protein